MIEFILENLSFAALKAGFAKIKLFLLVGAITGAFWAGMEWEKGQVAQDEAEEHTEEVETHNENTITQDDHEAAMLQLERDLRKNLHDLRGMMFLLLSCRSAYSHAQQQNRRVQFYSLPQLGLSHSL